MRMIFVSGAASANRWAVSGWQVKIRTWWRREKWANSQAIARARSGSKLTSTSSMIRGGLGNLPPRRLGQPLFADSLIALRLDRTQHRLQAVRLASPFVDAAGGKRPLEGGDARFAILNQRGELLPVSEQTQPRLKLR